MRLHGSDAKGAPHRVVALPDFGELLDDAWGEAQPGCGENDAQKFGSAGWGTADKKMVVDG